MLRMGMLRIALSALVSRTRTGLDGLAATSLLQEAFETLTRVKAAHWCGSSIADVPEMIQELARDRDDYKRMAESYRVDLAKAEAKIQDWRSPANGSWQYERGSKD